MKKIYLKKNKEKPVINRHPWIFSGAIRETDDAVENGSTVSVHDSKGDLLGYGYYNASSQIAVRMLSFGGKVPDPGYYRELILNAVQKRKDDISLRETDSYRIVFSEGDFFPGLIADRYGSHLVVQVLTLGIEKIKNELVNILTEIFNPESIYERSDHGGRRLESLEEYKGQAYGTTPDEIIIHESSMRFIVDVKSGQKTGFYLDQRDNRRLVRDLSSGKMVLNLFSYTGGFAVASCAGGAERVISVDSSEQANRIAKRNAELNGFSDRNEYIREDVFTFLRGEMPRCGLIIIDPPALAKSRDNVQNAARGYKDINMLAIKKCWPGSLILTCSCSRYIDTALFQKILFSAAADAGRNAVILKKMSHPSDHPVSLFCPESEYLKSFLLYIE